MQKIKNKSSKTFVYQFDSNFHIESPSDNITLDFSDQEYLSKSSEFINNLKIDFVEIIHLKSAPSIIPISYFDEKLKSKYMTTNSISSKNILTDTSNDEKIKIVYSISDKLNKFISSNKLNYSDNNYFTYLYNFLSNRKNKKSGMSFFVNLNNKSFDVIVYNDDEFLFFNSFEINDENEFLYYIFFVLKNYTSSNKDDKIIFLGKFERFSNYYTIASKYSQIDFIEKNNSIKVIHDSPFFSTINENYIRK
mgnify:CR=1 FL=1|tara:strand:+ start:2158 stop:2907 length:750 start_codon:yes stop_codon:yes gene_type:complete